MTKKYYVYLVAFLGMVLFFLNGCATVEPIPNYTPHTAERLTVTSEEMMDAIAAGFDDLYGYAMYSAGYGGKATVSQVEIKDTFVRFRYQWAGGSDIFGGAKPIDQVLTIPYEKIDTAEGIHADYHYAISTDVKVVCNWQVYGIPSQNDINFYFKFNTEEIARKFCDAVYIKQKILRGEKSFTYFERGLIHFNEGRTQEAKQDALRFIENHPRFNFFKNEPLSLYDIENRDQQTFEALQKAQKAEAEGNYLVAFKAYDEAYGVMTDRQKGKEDEVIASLIRCYKKAPQKPKYPEEARRYMVQAQKYATLNQDKKAIKAYEKVYSISPWTPEASFNQALIYGKLGETAMVDKDPQSKEHFKTAIFWMKRYLDIAPQAENARTAQDKIYEWEAFTK